MRSLDRLADALLYRLWQLGAAVTQTAPISITYPFASALADVAWLVLPAKRLNTLENMQRVFADRDPARARRAARRSFENYATYVVDFMRQAALSDDYLRSHAEIPYWPQLDAVLAEGKGCILVLTHCGNWDFGAAAIALAGYPFSAIAESQGQGRLNDAIFAARSKRGVRLIPMERAATGIIRAMRRNEVLAILIDRPLPEGGVEVGFFGAPARVPEGPARIALRTGAKIIPVSLVRVTRRKDRFRAIADFGVDNPATGDAKRDVQTLTQAIMTSHERVIRCNPDQWYMFRRMWPQSDPPTDAR